MRFAGLTEGELRLLSELLLQRLLLDAAKGVKPSPELVGLVNDVTAAKLARKSR